MRYPKDKLRPPPAGYLRWATSKDGIGRLLQNKQKLETRRRKIANKSRRIQRAKKLTIRLAKRQQNTFHRILNTANSQSK